MTVHNTYPRHTRGRMSPNAVRNENSLYMYIPGYSKCILKILTAFWVHSKYSGPFLWPARMFLSCLKHSRCIQSGKISNGIRTALWLHSKYSYGPLYGIPTIFETFWSPSKENRNGKPLQILPECPECASNEPECTSNAFRLLPESISILQEFSWNAIQMSSESFDCRSNAARIPSERPDWPSNESGRNSEHRRIAYLGIYKYNFHSAVIPELPPECDANFESSSFWLVLLDSCWFEISVTGVLEITHKINSSQPNLMILVLL